MVTTSRPYLRGALSPKKRDVLFRNQRVKLPEPVCRTAALFPKSTIKPQLPQPQVTVTLGAF